MRKSFYLIAIVTLAFGLAANVLANTSSIRLKDLGRIEGQRGNALTGYGLVFGLSGTGDSARSKATLQSISNTLREFGVFVAPEQMNARNVAAVLVTATLPPFSNEGDALDINVSSVGDARSLLGGTLMLAPLQAVDGKIYALAQGPISVGGYRYDSFGNLVQKNHPTVGHVPGGAVVERSLEADLVNEDGRVHFLLKNPDFTTAGRIVDSINANLGAGKASPVNPGKIRIQLSDAERQNYVALLRKIESLEIVPDQKAKVIVNERTGTVVAGEAVKLSSVVISHGELKIAIANDYQVSQPVNAGAINVNSRNVSTVTVPQTEIQVEETGGGSVVLESGASVAELVSALRKIKVSTRDLISILQTLRSAGSLHAELVIQ